MIVNLNDAKQNKVNKWNNKPKKSNKFKAYLFKFKYASRSYKIRVLLMVVAIVCYIVSFIWMSPYIRYIGSFIFGISVGMFFSGE